MDLLQNIYDATNNGLDIILHYYPQASDCVDNRKFFKIRDQEKTPSACLKLIKGVYRVTDFGNEGIAQSPIDICKKEEGLTFKEALYLLAERYECTETINSNINKPIIESRSAKKSEKDGDFSYLTNDKFSEAELKVWGPHVKQETLDKYKYLSIKSYSKTKEGKTTTIKSTEEYPIFMRDCGEFKKIYQPLNPNKEFRFFYAGTKPKDYINGLAELNKGYDDLENEDSGKEKKEKTKRSKIQECIICSGERDAMNVAGMGYFPLWLNSETDTINEKTFKEISYMVNKIYNVPDLDDTGLKQGIKMALKYIDIYTVILPNKLTTYKDNRGRPRKDIRDFVEIYPYYSDFSNLLKIAKCCRFWQKRITKDNVGYEIVTENLLYFLELSGFGQYEEKEAFEYVKITDYVVEKIKPLRIRAYIRNFLNEQYVESEIRNLFLNSKRSGLSSISDLKELNIDFTDNTQNSQMFFFKNVCINVFKDNIININHKEIKNYIWDTDIIKQNFKRIEPAFTFSFGKDEKIDFRIKNTNSHLFRYLINSSRMYWRTEFEEISSPFIGEDEDYKTKYKYSIFGDRLNEEQQNEQLQHLINKIFAIGYLLHRYKNESKAWAVWSMENKITEEDESSGGSGKSLLFNFLKNIISVVELQGRTKKLTENPHVLDRIRENTDLLLIEDTLKYFDFDFFYPIITGEASVNSKFKDSISFDFKKSSKIAFTSNFPPPNDNDSTLRRLLFIVYSDYYHRKSDKHKYKEERVVADDFGYNLWNETYKEEYWNEDFNFMIDCIQLYLTAVDNNIKIEPPMKNVKRRLNIDAMGEQFKEWAEVYFSKGSENVNVLVKKSDAFANFVNISGLKGWSSKRFNKAIKAFCLNTEYIETMNPPELATNDRILKKIDGITQEYIYIKTKGIEIDVFIK